MMEYIDLFFDKADVVMDLKPYLRLMNVSDDVISIRDRLRERINIA